MRKDYLGKILKPLLYVAPGIIILFLVSGSITYGQILTDQNFTIYYQDPTNHLGQYTVLTGKVFHLIPERDGTAGVQMYLSGDSNKNIIVSYNATSLHNSSNENDCVKVVGTTGEVIDYTNLFGGSLSAPSISAISINKISCLDLIDPTAKTVKVEQTQTKGGIKVTLHKIEFSDKETRAFLTVDNTNRNENSEVTFYGTSNSIAFQGNKQFEPIYSSNYPDIKSSIPAGIEENGVVPFEPLDKNQTNAKFQFKMSNELFNDYKFIFNVRDSPK